MGYTAPHILLRSYMTEQQRHDYKEYGHFWVIDREGHVYQLFDGHSVVQWTTDRYGHQMEVCSYHVWATRDYADDYEADLHTSLLTQLIFLTSKHPMDMIGIACRGGSFRHDRRGIPPMMGTRVKDAHLEEWRPPHANVA